MNFKELKAQASSQWEAMQDSDKIRILIGMGTCGRAAGAEDILNALNQGLTEQHIQAEILQVGCIGLCYAEPLIEVIKPGKPSIFYGNLTPELVAEIIEDYLIADNPRCDLALGTRGEGTVEGIPRLFDLPVLKPQVRISLRNCGNIDPENINHYIANGGYEGLAKALKMKPQEVIDEVKKSGLRGRGGAGFPTGVKWQFCHDAPGDIKYIICNAEEGEPGIFKDRVIMEGNPHAVIEGMAIAGYAMGAKQGYIYIQSGYLHAIEIMRHAVAQAKRYGFLGKGILDTNFDFEVSIHLGGGAYVSGEETAQLESIEGKRAIPRLRPPFPAQSGLFGKPTTVNNVETLVNIPYIILEGANHFNNLGTEKSRGTKVFALEGKVNNTGLIELPLGITLGQIIFDIGGGIPNGKKFKAALVGGPTGGCIPQEYLNTAVDYESLGALGGIMGSGGIIVMDEDNCIVDMARFFLSFTALESCGKCIPCRWGTKQMLDILEDITRGRGKIEDIDLLVELGESIMDGSLCGLGQAAPNPVLSSIRYFRGEYESHIRRSFCPASVCEELIKIPS